MICAVFYAQGEVEVMKEALIEIETFDTSSLAKDFFSEGELRAGSEIEIAKGTFLRLEGFTLREAVNVPEIIRLTIIIARDIALPIALGIASNWLYDKIKKGRTQKIVIEGKEVQMDRDKIKEMLMREIKDRPTLKKYFCRLSFPDFSKDELERAARTLSCRPIIFDEKELPYPDNMSYFAEYWLGNVEIVVYIRDEEINRLYEEGKPIYAKAQIVESLLPRLFFANLVLSLEATPCKMKEIEKEEDMPSWY